MSYSDNILRAINIITNEKMKDIQFNKIIYGVIIDVIDLFKNQYMVQYEDITILAYALGDKTYHINDNVQLLVPNNNLANDIFIIDMFTEEERVEIDEGFIPIGQEEVVLDADTFTELYFDTDDTGASTITTKNIIYNDYNYDPYISNSNEIYYKIQADIEITIYNKEDMLDDYPIYSLQFYNEEDKEVKDKDYSPRVINSVLFDNTSQEESEYNVFLNQSIIVNKKPNNKVNFNITNTNNVRIQVSNIRFTPLIKANNYNFNNVSLKKLIYKNDIDAFIKMVFIKNNEFIDDSNYFSIIWYDEANQMINSGNSIQVSLDQEKIYYTIFYKNKSINNGQIVLNTNNVNS